MYVHPIPAYHGRVGHIPVRPILHHMYNICVYPYVCPITSYHGRMGHIPVCPILIPHVHVHVYPYIYVHPVPLYHGRVGHIPVCPIYHMYVCVSLCPSRPSVPWESGTHPSPSHIPHVCVCILTSIPYHCTMGEWDTSQCVPYTICMCVYPYVHPVPPYHGRVGHIPVCPIYLPHVCVCILTSILYHRTMGEWDTSRFVPYTTCMCVSLRPYRTSVPWESGTYPSPSHIPHVRIPYVCSM